MYLLKYNFKLYAGNESWQEHRFVNVLKIDKFIKDNNITKYQLYVRAYYLKDNDYTDNQGVMWKLVENVLCKIL